MKSCNLVNPVNPVQKDQRSEFSAPLRSRADNEKRARRDLHRARSGCANSWMISVAASLVLDREFRVLCLGAAAFAAYGMDYLITLPEREPAA